jgi:hypothetical protein
MSDGVSLKEHFEGLLSAEAKLEDERWKAHYAVHLAEAEEKKAALATMAIRLEGMNEFRAQMAKEREQYLKQDIYVSEHHALEVKVTSNGEWISNMSGRLWMLGAMLITINILIGFAFRFLGK